MLKIGYFVPQFPGQTHSFFQREIVWIEKLGIIVKIISTRLPPNSLISHDWSEEYIKRTYYLNKVSFKKYAASLRYAGAILEADILREGKGLFQDAIFCLPLAKALADECSALGVEHVHVHSCGRAALIAALASRITGLSYSLTLHGPLSDYGPGQGLKWRGAAFATVITNKLLMEAEETLQGDLPDRVIVQAMGVDTDEFSRAEAYRPRSPGEPVKIFSCGRLNLTKGHQDLLQAVCILRNEGLDFRLEIAGEDDVGGRGFRKILESQIDELNLRGKVNLLGSVSEPKIKEKLLDAHLFVLASWHEPLGVVYMEAMSCGVPTIGTDAGGVRELIQDQEDGLLVRPKDPEALAAAVLSIANDPTLASKLSRKAREKVENRFCAAIGARTLVDEINRHRG
jgi:glycosyltransferase involved in cell wall biosynthesis